MKKLLSALAAMIMCATLSHAQETISIETFRKAFPNVEEDSIVEAEIARL